MMSMGGMGRGLYIVSGVSCCCVRSDAFPTSINHILFKVCNLTRALIEEVNLTNLLYSSYTQTAVPFIDCTSLFVILVCSMHSPAHASCPKQVSLKFLLEYYWATTSHTTLT